MAHGYMGRTTIDIAASIAVVLFLTALIVAVSVPVRQLQRASDEVRTDGVRQIMEAFLELQTVDPVAMDAVRAVFAAAGEAPRVMIGNGQDCSGDWGIACGDTLLSDGCVDLARPELQAVLPVVPVDPDEPYSARQTGYYVTFAPGVLEVGSCNPQLQEAIQLERTFF